MGYFSYKNKKVYYEEIGDGNPLLLLHGNTASSKMFGECVSKYSDEFKVILIDFMGCGKSERVESFSDDLWFDEAMQVISFLEEKKYTKIDIIGTSGGAMAAINVALERPDLVKRIVADSFEGIEADSGITDTIKIGRDQSKKDKNAALFYEFMNGPDWEKVVDDDTNAIIYHAKNIKKFFHKPISELKVETLLTGNREDPFFEKGHFERLFAEFETATDKCKFIIYENTGHPAMMSNLEDFVKTSKEFLMS